jgi:hypothetical protein
MQTVHGPARFYHGTVAPDKLELEGLAMPSDVYMA